jgi:hypothetical protein
MTNHPRCQLCGGTNLLPDPAAHYEDGVGENGEPLYCADCRHHQPCQYCALALGR